mgnify:FL=1
MSNFNYGKDYTMIIKGKEELFPEIGKKGLERLSEERVEERRLEIGTRKKALIILLREADTKRGRTIKEIESIFSEKEKGYYSDVLHSLLEDCIIYADSCKRVTFVSEEMKKKAQTESYQQRIIMPYKIK